MLLEYWILALISLHSITCWGACFITDSWYGGYVQSSTWSHSCLRAQASVWWQVFSMTSSHGHRDCLPAAFDCLHRRWLNHTTGHCLGNCHYWSVLVVWEVDHDNKTQTLTWLRLADIGSQWKKIKITLFIFLNNYFKIALLLCEFYALHVNLTLIAEVRCYLCNFWYITEQF